MNGTGLPVRPCINKSAIREKDEEKVPTNIMHSPTRVDGHVDNAAAHS